MKSNHDYAIFMPEKINIHASILENSIDKVL